MKRVVVTGIGAVTSLGHEIDEFWDNIKKGNVGIDSIEKFDTSDYNVKLAAEIKNFNPECILTTKERRRMDLFSQYAVYSAYKAFVDSNLDEDYVKDNTRVGIYFSSGIGGLSTIEEQVIRMHEKSPSRVSPLYVPMGITNMAAGNIAIKFGINGISLATVTACAGSSHSLGEAYRNIKHGYSDVIIAGGSEASITKMGIAGFMALTALSKSEDKNRASIPFDRERSGFVSGEGAGSLVLEEYEHAKKRGAKIYAEIVGYGATTDAYHITSPDPEGTWAAAAINQALNEAGISPEELGYINAHGTSTEYNDAGETKAIKKALGKTAYDIPISSTKSMTGHLLGAAGAVEAIISCKALEEGFIPCTMNLEIPDPECDLNYVPNKGIKKDIKYAISESFGFGGHNAALCFKKWEE